MGDGTMKRRRQFNKDIKYPPKSYDSVLPYDVNKSECKLIIDFLREVEG